MSKLNVMLLLMNNTGSKLFRLIPPRQANDILLYGRHHPYACQSRYKDLLSRSRFERLELDVLHDLRQKYNIDYPADIQEYITDPNYDIADVLEVILNPGDVLYIPAFWFHEVVGVLSK